MNPTKKDEADYAAFLESERQKTEPLLRDLDPNGPGPEDRGDESEP